MRLVEVIKSVKDEDYLCRVVGATEVARLHDRGVINDAQRDAAAAVGLAPTLLAA